MPNLLFVGGAYKNRSIAINAQECINWYPEYYLEKEGAKTPIALIPTPGLKLFVLGTNLTSSGGIRGLYTTSTGRMFAVIGNSLLEITLSGTHIHRGNLSTTLGRISFADNGNSNGRGYGMILVDGEYGYMLNLSTNEFRRIVDPSFPACTHVVFIDGYFIVNEANSTKVWFSNLYNGLDWGDIQADETSTSISTIGLGSKTFTISTGLTTIDGTYAYIYTSYGWMYGNVSNYDSATGLLTVNVTDYYGSGEYGDWAIVFYLDASSTYVVAEGSPDYLIALTSVHNELWLFGDISTEIFYNNGSLPGDFRRIHGALINNGTVARYSVATNGSNVFWLGSSAAGHGQVWTANGYQPQKISTNSIDYIIENLGDITDAFGICYTQEGHEFYLLTFPTANKTLCFDMSTGEWHERAYYNASTGHNERIRANAHCFFNGKNYVGDYYNGNIYELDLNTYTDNGDIIRRVRSCRHLHNDRKRIGYREFEIDVERGTGLANPSTAISQGIDPQIMLQWSDDGGFTWSNEYWVTLGQVGTYKTRVHWHRLGKSRDRIFRVSFSDPCKCIIIGARVDIEVKERG